MVLRRGTLSTFTSTWTLTFTFILVFTFTCTFAGAFVLLIITCTFAFTFTFHLHVQVVVEQDVRTPRSLVFNQVSRAWVRGSRASDTRADGELTFGGVNIAYYT